MDAVITYVDGLDPQWQASYREYVGGGMVEKRFRDWGTLRYLLRGIETCMPFIGNVYLVVASRSQVPQWADTEHLRIVLHGDIIPSYLLPVFNSCTIEMFLHRIPELAEEFIYFNDDMFPLMPCAENDFFESGKGKIGMAREFFTFNMYKKQCRVSDRLARKALGMKPGLVHMRPQHICSPMLLSASVQAFAAVEADILASASRLRKPENPNQYFYLDYMYYSGSVIPERISNRHLSQGMYSGEQIARYILAPETSFACINDVAMPDDRFVLMRQSILNAFGTRFPDISRFEKKI